MKDSHQRWEGVIKRYKDFIDISPEEKIITLFEGNTPLIPSVALVKELREMGFRGEIYFKHEGLNPTSSFKDRGMTVAVTKALSSGARAIICASTGNTSASAAAYGARAGLPVFVLVPEKDVALGKLCQAIAHGANIIKVKGNFDVALELVKKIAEDFGLFVVNSINPWRIEGQKTAAFEVCDQLGDAPDYHFIPVGNAANIWAYWVGYKQYKEKGLTTKLPKMFGFQAEGSAPIVRGHPVENPQTVASAIRIGNPANWRKAEKARDESGGTIDMVSDEEILKAYRFLGSREGIFCEPASCAGVAGLVKMVKKGVIKDGTVVCTITGHGLKDPDTALTQIPVDQITVDPDYPTLKKLFEKKLDSVR